MLAVAGCRHQSSPTSATGGGATLAVSPDSVLATSLGQHLSITVTLGGRPVASPTLSVRSEQRWLDDHPVLDASALAGGTLVASAPGRAVVTVSSGAASDSVIVNVKPSQPVVMATELPGGRTHIGSGDTIVARGYRMDEVPAGDVIARGATVTVTSQDSANLRFVVPTDSVTGCSGAAPATSIVYQGVAGDSVGGLTRKRTGEVALAVGAAQRLTSAEAACLRLAPAAGARYVLAYADTRLVTKAQTGPEYPPPDSITVLLTDRTDSTAAFRSALSAALTGRAVAVRPAAAPSAGIGASPQDRPMGTPGADVPMTPAPGCPYTNYYEAFCRNTPYALGDTFTYYPDLTSRSSGLARVMAIQGNLVLSVFEPDSAMLAPDAIAWADTALAFTVQRAVPLYETMFNLSAPATTSDGSGQLLMGVEAGSVSSAIWWPDASGNGEWAKISIGLASNSAFGDPLSSPTRELEIIAHEVLHAYQYRWRWEHAGPWLTYLGTAWAVEGSAHFVSDALVREYLGIPFLSNYALAQYAPNDPHFPLTIEAAPVHDFTLGGPDAASFLRDLVQRLVHDGGMSFDAAVGQVVVGALEGWYGINEDGQHDGPGLTARMQAHLGSSWNPVDALLQWTLSQAADGLTTNPVFQNLTYQLPNQSLQNNFILPGGVVGDAPGASAAAAVKRLAGNTGVFDIEDSAGGSYHTAGTVAGVPSSALQWMLLRIS